MTATTTTTRPGASGIPAEVSVPMIHALSRIREVRALLTPPPFGGQIAKVRAKADLLERDLCAVADAVAAWGRSLEAAGCSCEGDPAPVAAPCDVSSEGEVCAKAPAGEESR